MLADGTGKEVASCSGDAQLTAHTRSTGSAEWKFSGEISGTLTCDLGKDIGVIIETTLEGTTPCPDSTSWGDACGTATITAGTETAEANWYGGFGDSGSLDGSMSGAFVYGGVAVTYTQSFEAFKGE